jgi:hypothetical protein
MSSPRGSRIDRHAMARARDTALTWAVSLRAARVGLVLGAVTVAFALLATLHFVVGGPFGLFRPDGEGKPPAAFAAALLLATGLLAVLGPVPTSQHRIPWRGIGLVLCLMAVDEGLLVHERLQSLTGVDWVTLYAPVIVVAAVLWLRVATDMRAQAGALALWVGGAICWAAAQVLEQKSWEPGGIRVDGWEAMSVIEEALEAAGTSAFLLGMLLALRAPSVRAAVRVPRRVGNRLAH